MEVHAPPDRVPIETDTDGVIRVGGTRVTLDTLIAAFDAGATAEEIAQQYDSVTLADVYSVIGYYLRHQSEVRAYLAERQQKAAESREEDERRFDPKGVRDRLLARRR
jgi:uncharacterized protein (DUF433 family)